MRVFVRFLLLLLPFLLLSFGVYHLFLSQYDINYYIAVKPPNFWIALVLVVIIWGVFLISLIMKALNWTLALPVLLFENKNVKGALKESQRKSKAWRGPFLVSLIQWSVWMVGLSVLATGLLALLARVTVPSEKFSSGLIFLFIGITVLLFIAVQTAVSLIQSSSFGHMLLQVYQSDPDKSPVVAINMKERESLPLTRRTLVWMSLLGLSCSLMFTSLLLSNAKISNEVSITAHRGSSLGAPENTMAAVKLAIEEGADWVEIDVQRTRDDRVVLAHDRDLRRVGRNSMSISGSNFTDLVRVDIGSWFDPKFKNQRLPLLEDVLAVCKNKIKVNIETKDYDYDPQLGKRIVELVEKKGMNDQVKVMAFRQQTLHQIQKLQPQIKRGFLTNMILGNLSETEANFVAVNRSLAKSGFIREMHQKNKRVHVWTVNDKQRMLQFMSRGIDNIITDDPKLGVQVRDSWSNLNQMERFLIKVGLFLDIPLENL